MKTRRHCICTYSRTSGRIHHFSIVANLQRIIMKLCSNNWHSGTRSFHAGRQWRRQLWGTGARAPSTSNSFIFSSLWSKSDSQLSKYCVVSEISWCRCQQLTALSISTVLVTKLLVIEQLLHLALKSTVSAPWPTFQLCPYSQQILATPLQGGLRTARQLTRTLICR